MHRSGGNPRPPVSSYRGRRHRRRVTPYDKKVVAARQLWRCNECDDLLSAHFEVDHIISLGAGGTNASANLQALCANCHNEKTAADRRERQLLELDELDGVPIVSRFFAHNYTGLRVIIE
jgi:5-methylcytosine-specific restriction endonuclease McrA